MEELIDRLRDRFNEFWHSEKRSVKLIARALAFTLFAAVISTIAPTLARTGGADSRVFNSHDSPGDSDCLPEPRTIFLPGTCYLSPTGGSAF
jgi:hypothetical protein